MPSFKRERVSELIQGFLADEIRRLADPRLELITLTGVDMSPDLKNATVFWSVLSLDAQPVDAIPTQSTPEKLRPIEDALEGATSLLKRRIGAELKLRYTPRLVFRFDHSVENACRIDYLVKKAGSN